MRPYVRCLNTDAMAWETTEDPGLFTRPLSRDPKTGERTALQRIDVAEGYAPPPTAHYHHLTDEEILLARGGFTFDSETWLKRLSYCFHPADTVHGFKSAVAGEAWFISRTRVEPAFNLVWDPEQRTPYDLEHRAPRRAVRVIPDPEQEEWTHVRDANGNIVLSRLILSEDPVTGEGSMLVRHAPGWRSPHGEHFHTVYEEAFVLEGEIETEDGTIYSAGCYISKPPYALQSSPSSPKGALVYINYGGRLDFRPAAERDRALAAAGLEPLETAAGSPEAPGRARGSGPRWQRSR